MIEIVGRLYRNAPSRTFRNPEYRQRATELAAAAHDRFVARNGGDLIVVQGADLSEVYAQALTPDEPGEEAISQSRAMVHQWLEAAEIGESEAVLVLSHPMAGIGIYQGFEGAVRALESGADADPADLERLRQYLNDESVPRWALDRLITDRLPAAEAALARALRRPGFSWARDGERLLDSTPGEQEPTLGITIMPSLLIEGSRVG
ncbi:MAG: hypothetical protein QM619_00475 [Micropruina sp.]|uniref:hypothetical protein n=1 Tax=Micropruina sp. TaxID=2737536 RepID=UPI0039E2FC58